MSGTHPEKTRDRKPISVKIGRFLVLLYMIGTVEDEEKPRFAQMKKGPVHETITLEESTRTIQITSYIGRI